MQHRQPDPIGADPEPGEAPGITPNPSVIPTGSRVLLLNATFEPLAVVAAKRAVVLLLTGKGEWFRSGSYGQSGAEDGHRGKKVRFDDTEKRAVVYELSWQQSVDSGVA